MDKNQIIQEMLNFINKNGGEKKDWYVGITDNIERRLFGEHNVSKMDNIYIYRNANNSEDAEEIEKYFVQTLGTDGGAGGGDEDTTFVYAYKKTKNTNP